MFYMKFAKMKWHEERSANELKDTFIGMKILGCFRDSFGL